MTTGTGIVISMLMYLMWQCFLVWLSSERTARRPAATEARLERIEMILREYTGYDL